MSRFTLIAGAALALASGAAGAADFDGSKKLICAPVDVHECVEGSRCRSFTPRTAGAPEFLRVDVGAKQISGPKRTTQIANVVKGDQQILLTGTELDWGWTLAIDSTDGAMTLTLADRDGAYVLFGSCTPL